MIFVIFFSPGIVNFASLRPDQLSFLEAILIVKVRPAMFAFNEMSFAEFVTFALFSSESASYSA